MVIWFVYWKMIFQRHLPVKSRNATISETIILLDLKLQLQFLEEQYRNNRHFSLT